VDEKDAAMPLHTRDFDLGDVLSATTDRIVTI
jgi:hypothetical protein